MYLQGNMSPLSVALGSSQVNFKATLMEGQVTIVLARLLSITKFERQGTFLPPLPLNVPMIKNTDRVVN
jgi:hypothetical protein